MPLRIIRPNIKRFELTEADPEGDTFVDIKQATQHAVERRAAATESRTHVLGEGKDAVRVVSKFNYPEVQRYESYLTMVGCNIENVDGTPLFVFKDTDSGFSKIDMTEGEFEIAWGKLPPGVAEEIHGYVVTQNPMWNFSEDDEDGEDF